MFLSPDWMNPNINKMLNLRGCGPRKSLGIDKYKTKGMLCQNLIETLLWMLFKMVNSEIQFLPRKL